MRCGSAGTSALSGVTPAALRADRIGGPGSTRAGSGAQDSSGRRWLPNTPASAILVVLVITDPAGEFGGLVAQPATVTNITASTALSTPNPSALIPARREHPGTPHRPRETNTTVCTRPIP